MQEPRKIDAQVPVKLFTDCEYSKQPENTIRFALNVVSSSLDGSLGSIPKENGNELCITIDDRHADNKSTFHPCGHIVVNKDRVLGFYTYNKERDYTIGNDPFYYGLNEGVIVDINLKTCEYKILASGEFNFSPSYPIKGYVEVKNGCDTVAYWVDSLNPDRYFNVDRPSVHQDANGQFEIHKFNITPVLTKLPNVQAEVQTYGGKLKLGKYYMVFEYYDNAKNLLHRSLPEGPISIYPGNISLESEGGYNIESFTPENGGKKETTKSIKIQIKDAYDFSFVRLNIISYTAGDNVSRTAHIVNDYFAIEEGQAEIMYVGMNASRGDYEVDSASLLQRLVAYRDAKVIKTYQNRQLRYNLKERPRDYSSYQQQASKIKTSIKTKTIPYGDIEKGHPLHPNTLWECMSERRSEIRPYGIVYVHDDFTLSPVFHIPGRMKRQQDETIITTRARSLCPDYPAKNAPSIGSGSFSIQFQRGVLNLLAPPPNTDLRTYERFIISNTVPIANLQAWHISVLEVPNSSLDNLIANTINYSTGDLLMERDALTESSLKRTIEITVIVNNYTYKAVHELSLESYESNFITNPINLVQNVILDFQAVDDGDINRLQRYKVYSTSYTDGQDNLYCGYHESCVNTYPKMECASDYWGVDYEGNKLEGSPIRHHYMPNTHDVPIMTPGTIQGDTTNNQFEINIMGVEFSNIDYPDSSIIGHFFVSGFGEDTIVANGITSPHSTRFERSGPIPRYNSINPLNGSYVQYVWDGQNSGHTLKDDIKDSALMNLITPEFLFESKYETASQVKVFHRIICNSLKARSTSFTSDYNVDNYFTEDFDDLRGLYKKYTMLGKVLNDPLDFPEIYQMRKSVRINRREHTFIGIAKVHNDSYTNNFNIVQLNRKYTKVTGANDEFNTIRPNVRYVALTKLIDAYNNLFNIRYRKIHSNILTLDDSQVVFGGDVFITKLDVNNIPMFNADIDSGVFDAGKVQVEAELIANIFVETKINTELRHSGTQECNKYYSSENDMVKIVLEQISSPTNSTRHNVKLRPCASYFGYNIDYSFDLLPLYIYNSIDRFFNFCSKCINKYPNRIIWTDPTTEEQTLTRDYKPLNYVDIPAIRGEIVDVSFTGNLMLVRTSESMYAIQANNQQLQASNSSIYLGLGSFLGLPANEFVINEVGKYGQQKVLSSTNSPVGPLWIDQKEGEIHWFQQNVKTISNNDNYYFFKEALPSKSELVFPFVDLSKIQTVFDNFHKRFIISKIDYVYTEKFEGMLIRREVVFDETIGMFRELSGFGDFTKDQLKNEFPKIIYTIDDAKLEKKLIGAPTTKQPGKIIPYSDKDYFVNKSFTKSYAISEGWKSFHSYIPEMMFANHETFFTVISTLDVIYTAGVEPSPSVKIYKHNFGKRFTNFYGSDFPFIIEYIIKDFSTFELEALHYYAKSYSGKTEIREVTFNYIWCYTNNHSTGLSPLNFSNSEFDDILNSSGMYVKESDRDYKVANIWDRSSARPLSSNDWDDIKDAYNNMGQGYIDKTSINTPPIPLYEYGTFRDKYAVVRLISASQNQYQTILDVIQSMKYYGS